MDLADIARGKTIVALGGRTSKERTILHLQT